MYGLKRLLDEEKSRMEHIRDITEKNLIDVPDGSLWVSKNKKQVMLFHYNPEINGEWGQGKYITKAETDLAQRLAQKEYDSKLLTLVNKRIKQISSILKDYAEDEVEEVYNGLHEIKRELITPAEESWRQKVAKWKNTPYEGKGFEQGIPVIITKKGERVRSKSEKILADTFYDYGIEYKYECPLVLRGYGTVYPDFTFLNRRNEKEIYWEHDGRMDDADYCNTAIRKIDSYIRNGIFPGERLILSYETSNYVLNSSVVKDMIEKYLL